MNTNIKIGWLVGNTKQSEDLNFSFGKSQENAGEIFNIDWSISYNFNGKQKFNILILCSTLFVVFRTYYIREW